MNTESHPPTPSKQPLASSQGAQAVSGERVLAALHSAADLRQARDLSDDDVRATVAVAYALREIAARQMSWSNARQQLAAIDIPVGTATLDALRSASGATPRQVARGLELLLASQVILRVPGRPDVRFSTASLIDIPGSLVTSDLTPIRGALRERHAAVMPAVAVLHHLRQLKPNTTGWVVSPLEEIATRTFFKRSTVARAIADLEATGAIERARQTGLRSHYRLIQFPVRADAPGFPSDVSEMQHDPGERARRPDSVSEAPVANELAVQHLAVDGSAGQSAITGSSVSMPDTSRSIELTGDEANSWPVIEISGVAFPIPPGARINAELDAQGHLWYRLGSARLGPIRFVKVDLSLAPPASTPATSKP